MLLLSKEPAESEDVSGWERVFAFLYSFRADITSG